MQLDEHQLNVMDAEGHLLVTGGPGSGKTTVSTLKAAQITGRIGLHQTVMFLGFARATVSRVIEAIDAEKCISPEQKRKIDVDTYHAFFWRVLSAHGYLVGLPRRLRILTPPNEAIALSAIRRQYSRPSKLTQNEREEKERREYAERLRLARHDGLVCFDLFAPLVADILDASDRIRSLIATMHPYVILDEFQDTNAEQWRAVRAIGKKATLLALADPEQRIYDWIGADPARIKHFCEAFKPTTFDFGSTNHRSLGTDICSFGNDVLTGKFRNGSYNGVTVRLYDGNAGQAGTALVTNTFAARSRIAKRRSKDWCLAVLVPTKKLTRVVSDTFRSPPAGMTPIAHTAVVEMEAAILAAEIIAHMIAPDEDGKHFGQLVDLLRNYFHGKGGDTPSTTSLKEAERLSTAYNEFQQSQLTNKAMRKRSIILPLIETYHVARSMILSGNPDTDWREMRRALEHGRCVRLKEIAEEVRNVRILERGQELRRALSQEWRDKGQYTNALEIVRQAFIREHFASSSKPENGVVVMNMHKAKGKQFDEVIIFEHWPHVAKRKIVANPDRIVRENAHHRADDQARQNLRVSITRGRYQTTILTPKNDPCILLRGCPFEQSR